MKFPPPIYESEGIFSQSYTQQRQHVYHRLFIRVNFFHGHDYPVSIINSACYFRFDFVLRAYFTLSSAVGIRTFKRPPRSDNTRIRHARVIFPDMPGIAFTQNFLQQSQMRLRDKDFYLAIFHHNSCEYTGPEGLRSLFIKHSSSQTHEIFGTSPSLLSKFSGRQESLSLARVK